MNRWSLILTGFLMAVALSGCIVPQETSPPEDADQAEPVEEEDVRVPSTRAVSGNVSGPSNPVVTVPRDVTINETYPILLEAQTSGTWRLTTADWTRNVTTESGMGQVTAAAHPHAQNILLNWTFDDAHGTSSGDLSYDVWGELNTFPDEPEGEHILRPGIRSAACTTNFIFQYKWQRLFIGTAAHCIDNVDADDPRCTSTESEIGDTETLEGGIEVTHAYSSWTTQNAVGECEGGNDFGLFEIPPEHWDLLHPKSHGIVGHLRELGDCREMNSPGTGGRLVSLDIVAYGRSSLRSGLHVDSEPDRPVDDKVGEFIRSTPNGYSCRVYLATPGVPGDSGGPLATDDGLALGAAATIQFAPYPGSNHYTNIIAALEFMEEHEGWAPELVTSG